MEKLVREAVDQFLNECSGSKGKSKEDKKWVAIAKRKKKQTDKKKGK